jgi:hypothetical protein
MIGGGERQSLSGLNQIYRGINAQRSRVNRGQNIYTFYLASIEKFRKV